MAKTQRKRDVYVFAASAFAPSGSWLFTNYAPVGGPTALPAGGRVPVSIDIK